jgi:hypothetical protein
MKSYPFEYNNNNQYSFEYDELDDSGLGCINEILHEYLI